MLDINTEYKYLERKQVEERNQDQEIPRKLEKRRWQNQRSYQKKEKEIEERSFKTGNDAQNYSYEAMFRTNAELDKHSKDSKEANPVPENQSVNLERQLADKKGLRASLACCGNRFLIQYSPRSI